MHLSDNYSTAFYTSAAAHSVYIINQSTMEFGSGTLIRVSNRCLILTAAHVINGAPKQDLRFAFLQPGPLAFIDSLRVAGGTPAVHFTQMNVVDIRQDPKRDLAALVVDCDAVNPTESARFYEYPGRTARARNGETVVAIGLCESAVSKEPSPIRDQLGNLQYNSVLTPIVNINKVLPTDSFLLPINFDANCHFVWGFSHAAAGFSPRGLSGSAVWCGFDSDRSSQNQPIWSPIPNFAGVVLTYLSDYNLLVAIRAECVTQFLTDNFG